MSRCACRIAIQSLFQALAILGIMDTLSASRTMQKSVMLTASLTCVLISAGMRLCLIEQSCSAECRGGWRACCRWCRRAGGDGYFTLWPANEAHPQSNYVILVNSIYSNTMCDCNRQLARAGYLLVRYIILYKTYPLV
jgi:hypothetical protein